MTLNKRTLWLAAFLSILLWGLTALPVTWAMPNHSELLGTVPTRTPTPGPVADTPAPPPPTDSPPPNTPVPTSPSADTPMPPNATELPPPSPTASAVQPTPTGTLASSAPGPDVAVASPTATVLPDQADPVATPSVAASPSADREEDEIAVPSLTDTAAPTVTPPVTGEPSPALSIPESRSRPWLLIGGAALLVTGAALWFATRK